MVVAHEAPVTQGFGAEVSATIQVRNIMRSYRCDSFNQTLKLEN